MCQTGGPRCYTEAKQSAVGAEAAYRAAHARLEELSDERRRPGFVPTDEWYLAQREALKADGDALSAVRDAYCDLAATTAGADELRARAELSGAVGLPIELSQSILDHGLYQRRRGQIARAVRDRDESDDLTGILGRTGDPETDARIQGAARALAKDPMAYRVAPALPGVKQYASVQEKDAGVRRWNGAVHELAVNHKRAEMSVAEAERDVAMIESSLRATPEDEVVQQRLDRARTSLELARSRLRATTAELVVGADKLRIAHGRQVPDAPAGRASTRAIGVAEPPPDPSRVPARIPNSVRSQRVLATLPVGTSVTILARRLAFIYTRTENGWESSTSSNFAPHLPPVANRQPAQTSQQLAESIATLNYRTIVRGPR